MMYYHIDVITDCLNCKEERSVHFNFTSTGGILSHNAGRPANMFEGFCGRCRYIHTLLFNKFDVVASLEVTTRCMGTEGGAQVG